MAELADNTRDFREYVERMREIRLLSTPDLDDVNDADEYSAVLLRNFARIGELAAENRKVIDAYVKPVLASKENPSEEAMAQLTTFVDILVQDDAVEEVDAHLSDLIGDLLALNESSVEEYADESTRVVAMAKKIKRDYLIISGLTRYINDEIGRVRKKALENRSMVASYLRKERFVRLSDEAKGAVLQYCLMGVLFFENNIFREPSAYWRQPLDILREAEGILDDPFYHAQLPAYDWEAYEFRIYYYGSFLAYSVLPEDVALTVHEYARKALELLRRTKSEAILSAVNVEQEEDLLYLASVQARRTSAKEACDKLYEAFKARDTNDYSLTGINENLDTPSSYLRIAKTMGLELTEEDLGRYREIEHTVLAYFYNVPKDGDVYLKCVTCFTNLPLYFQEVPGAMTLEEFCVNAFAAIHPPTYIHVNMVARLSTCMARYLLDSDPAAFVGFPGCESADDVVARKEEILRYVYHASLCHDIGKLFIVDVISMYGRNLLNDEFAMIMDHPAIGARVAGENASTADYVDVIRGHHIWYDCSRGYPRGVNTFESPYKTVIDIVLAADCLDAATDTVGRSYSRGKTFEDVEREIVEGAGTQYAPFLPGLLRAPELRRDIKELLSAGRQDLYRETFLLLKNNGNR